MSANTCIANDTLGPDELDGIMKSIILAIVRETGDGELPDDTVKELARKTLEKLEEDVEQAVREYENPADIDRFVRWVREKGYSLPEVEYDQEAKEALEEVLNILCCRSARFTEYLL